MSSDFHHRIYTASRFDEDRLDCAAAPSPLQKLLDVEIPEPEQVDPESGLTKAELNAMTGGRWEHYTDAQKAWLAWRLEAQKRQEQ